MTRRITVAAGAALTLTLVACAPAPSASEAPATDGGAAGGAGSVDVSLTEFMIDMPSSIPAGEVTFNVTNDGTTEHAFEVEGGGMEEETEDLAPGDSATLTVTLEPGTYTIYCPVDDHRGMGMETELEVTES